MVDSHPRSTVVLMDTGAPGTSIYNDAIHQLDKLNSLPAIAIELFTQWLEHSVYNRGVASSSPIIGILTVNFSAGTRSSCVQ